MVAILTLLFALAPADDTLWTRAYSYPGSATDQGNAVAVLGNEIFVAGTDQSSASNILIIRYHSNGDTVWTRVCVLDSTDVVTDVAVGDDSAPVVCAQVQGKQPVLLLAKFSKTGDTVWTRHRARMQATRIALDNSGAVYVWGSLYGAAANESLGLFKYGADGTPAWEKTLTFGTMNQSAGLALAPDGGFIAAANISDSTGMHSTLFKFTSSGDTAWKRSPARLVGGNIEAVACEPSGSFYVSMPQASQTTVARCSTDAQVDWLESEPIQSLSGDCNMLAIDPDAHLVVAGVNASQQIQVIKLTQAGQPYANDTGPDSVTVYGLAADTAGDPIVVGMAHYTSPPACLTVKFTGAAGATEGGRPLLSGRPQSSRVGRADIPLVINVKSAGRYSVLLLDARGSVVRQLCGGFLSAGDHSFTPGPLAAGSYFLKVFGRSGASGSKLVQVK
jgi:hypothetical protein